MVSLMERETKKAIESITPLMPQVMIQTILPNVTALARVAIEPELERRLGHRVTEYNWECYWREVEAKQRQKNWYDLVDSLVQPLIDRQIIKGFVWGW